MRPRKSVTAGDSSALRPRIGSRARTRYRRISFGVQCFFAYIFSWKINNNNNKNRFTGELTKHILSHKSAARPRTGSIIRSTAAPVTTSLRFCFQPYRPLRIYVRQFIRDIRHNYITRVTSNPSTMMYVRHVRAHNIHVRMYAPVNVPCR